MKNIKYLLILLTISPVTLAMESVSIDLRSPGYSMEYVHHRNQGQLGNCYAFAAGVKYEAWLKSNNLVPKDFKVSILDAYVSAFAHRDIFAAMLNADEIKENLEATLYNGGFSNGVLDALNRYGVCDAANLENAIGKFNFQNSPLSPDHQLLTAIINEASFQLIQDLQLKKEELFADKKIILSLKEEICLKYETCNNGLEEKIKNAKKILKSCESSIGEMQAHLSDEDKNLLNALNSNYEKFNDEYVRLLQQKREFLRQPQINSLIKEKYDYVEKLDNLEFEIQLTEAFLSRASLNSKKPELENEINLITESIKTMKQEERNINLQLSIASEEESEKINDNLFAIIKNRIKLQTQLCKIKVLFSKSEKAISLESLLHNKNEKSAIIDKIKSEIITISKLNITNPYLFIRKSFDGICSSRVKPLEKLTHVTSKDKSEFAEIIENEFKKNESATPIIASIDSRILLGSQSERFGHTVLIIGMKKIGNKYFYLIRNSWGPDCAAHQTSGHECDRGDLWIAKEIIINNTRSLVY